jgi:hypothetical protein
MRENRPYGSEGGEGFNPSRPLSTAAFQFRGAQGTARRSISAMA